jgi:hypothetical protein
LDDQNNVPLTRRNYLISNFCDGVAKEEIASGLDPELDYLSLPACRRSVIKSLELTLAFWREVS